MEIPQIDPGDLAAMSKVADDVRNVVLEIDTNSGVPRFVSDQWDEQTKSALNAAFSSEFVGVQELAQAVLAGFPNLDQWAGGSIASAFPDLDFGGSALKTLLADFDGIDEMIRAAIGPLDISDMLPISKTVSEMYGLDKLSQLTALQMPDLPMPTLPVPVVREIPYTAIESRPTVSLHEYREVVYENAELDSQNRRLEARVDALEREVNRLQRGGPFEGTSDFPIRDPDPN